MDLNTPPSLCSWLLRRARDHGLTSTELADRIAPGFVEARSRGRSGLAGRTPYPQEIKERAVRMVGEVRGNYGNEYAAI